MKFYVDHLLISSMYLSSERERDRDEKDRFRVSVRDRVNI